MPPCLHCDKNLADSSSLRRHVQRIHPEKSNKVSRTTSPHQCNVCQTTFTRAESLRRHASKHKGASTTCDICSQPFSRDDYLSIHRLKCARKFLTKACERLEDRLCPGSYKLGESTFRRLEASLPTRMNHDKGKAHGIRFAHEYLLDVDTAKRALTQVVLRSLDSKCSDDFEEALVFAFRLHIDLRSIPELDAAHEKELIAFPQLRHVWIEALSDYVTDSDYDALLLMACQDGCFGFLEPLFWRGANIDYQDFLEKCTPLSLAAKHGRLDNIRLLLTLGADPDLYSPIHMAIREGKKDVVTLLVDHGASPQLYDCNVEHFTPLELAVAIGDLDMVDCLLSLQADPDNGFALSLSILNNRRDVATTLIRHGADIDKKRLVAIGYRTALAMAVQSRKVASVELALSLKADPNVGDPLLLALDLCQPEMALLLVQHGASVSVKDKELNTPLHIAARMAHADLVEAILAQDSSQEFVSAINTRGNQALHLALKPPALEQARPIVARLLQAGADATQKDQKLNSALKLAAIYGRASLVQLLLASKATSEPDQEWLAPAFRSAVRWKRVDIVRILIETGAKDDEGRLLVMAYEGAQPEIISMLERKHYSGLVADRRV